MGQALHCILHLHFPPKNPPSKKSSARTCICKTKKSKKPLLHLGRRSAPPAPIFGIPTRVLFGLHYTTKSEPISSARASRALRARGDFVREWSDSTSCPLSRVREYAHPRPRPAALSSMHIYFAGVLEIEWAAGWGVAFSQKYSVNDNTLCKYLTYLQGYSTLALWKRMIKKRRHGIASSALLLNGPIAFCNV